MTGTLTAPEEALACNDQKYRHRCPFILRILNLYGWNTTGVEATVLNGLCHVIDRHRWGRLQGDLVAMQGIEVLRNVEEESIREHGDPLRGVVPDTVFTTDEAPMPQMWFVVLVLLKDLTIGVRDAIGIADTQALHRGAVSHT